MNNLPKILWSRFAFPRLLTISGAAIAGLLTTPETSRAMTVSWEQPANITGNVSEVSTEGTVFGAWSFGSTTGSNIVVNGVSFTQVYISPSTYGTGTSGNLAFTSARSIVVPAAGQVAPFSTINASYKSLLNGSFWRAVANDNKVSFTISNLVPNQTYQVQVWSNYSTNYAATTRYSIVAGASTYTSPTLASSATATNGGLGQYITATITPATGETSVTITATGGPNNTDYCFVNALQVRAVDKAVWFKNAKYGIGINWNAPFPAGWKGIGDGTDATVGSNFAKILPGDDRSGWAKANDAFDVTALANQVAEAGASYVIFGVGGSTGFFSSPNAVYESAQNSVSNHGPVAAGEFTSKRDLVGDLADALNAKGIKLMVYIASEGPFRSYYVQRGASSTTRVYPSLAMNARDGIFDGTVPPDGTTEQRTAYSAAFRTKWHAMLAEWSNRWGSRVSGWWIDGVFHDTGYRTIEGADNDDPSGNLSALIAACKAGNAQSLVAPNPIVNHFGTISENQDYTASETGRYQDERGKFYDYPYTRFSTFGSNTQIQNQYYGYLGTWWNATNRLYVDEEIINYISSVNSKGVPVTLAVGADATGQISAIQMEQLKRIKAALNPTAVPVVTPKPVADFTNLALYKPAFLLASTGNYGEARLDPGTVQQNQPHAGVDGDPATFATTAAAGSIGYTYLVDLESVKDFNRVTVTFAPGYYSTSYRIDYSTTGLSGSWNYLNTTQTTYSNSSAGLKTHDSNGTKTGRYVRIVSLAPSGAGQPGNRMGVEDFAVSNVGGTASTAKETVWMDEEPPMGATLTVAGSGSWNIATSLDTNWSTFGLPLPKSGVKLHWSTPASGWNEHGFTGAAETFSVGVGDTLFCDVWLDPSNMPAEIMLIWQEVGGSSEHRAFWGSDLLGVGTLGTDSRRSMGALPASGQWVRLSVAANQVGLEGKTLKGMSFSTHGGKVLFDRTGKSRP